MNCASPSCVVRGGWRRRRARVRRRRAGGSSRSASRSSGSCRPEVWCRPEARVVAAGAVVRRPTAVVVVDRGGEVTRRAGEDVVVQRHRSGAGEGPAVDGDAGGDADRGERQDVAGEHRAGAERGGAADLPEHVALLGAVDQRHRARRTGDQRRVGLEDEHRVGVALAVEHERAGQGSAGTCSGPA